MSSSLAELLRDVCDLGSRFEGQRRKTLEPVKFALYRPCFDDPIGHQDELFVDCEPARDFGVQ